MIIEILKDIGVGLVVLISVATALATLLGVLILTFHVPYGWTPLALFILWCLGATYRDLN